MSTKVTSLINKAGETLGTLSFDEAAHSWRIATKAEPNFPSTFSTQQDAYFFAGIRGSTQRPASCGLKTPTRSSMIREC